MERAQENRTTHGILDDPLQPAGMGLQRVMDKTKNTWSTPSKRVECPQCHKTFVDVGRMKRHVNTIHLKTQVFECGICGARKNRKDNLYAHMRYVHKSENITVVQGESETRRTTTSGTEDPQ